LLSSISLTQSGLHHVVVAKTEFNTFNANNIIMFLVQGIQRDIEINGPIIKAADIVLLTT